MALLSIYHGSPASMRPLNHSNQTCATELSNVLRCARLSQYDAAQPPSLETRQSFIDAAAAVRARPYRYWSLAPLIVHALDTAGVLPDLDPDTQCELSRLRIQGIAKQKLIQRHTRELLSKFAEHRIPVILLKGTAFAGSLYPDHAPRLSADIDLLVSRQDFNAASGIIETSMQPVLEPRRPITREKMFERTFNPSNSIGTQVDLHRGLTNDYLFSISENALWSSSVRHPRYDLANVRMLSPEDTILHLAIHAFRGLHFFSHSLVDAHEALVQWNPDWRLLKAKARDWGATTILGHFLHITRCTMYSASRALDGQFTLPGYQHFLRRLLLSRSRVTDPLRKDAIYRLRQLVAQYVFVDNPLNVMRFQSSYVLRYLQDAVR